MTNDKETELESIKVTKKKTMLFLLSALLLSITSVIADKVLGFFSIIFFILAIISGLQFIYCIPLYLKALEEEKEINS
jgi:hypothetical protein